MRLPTIENYENNTLITTMDIPKVSPVEKTYVIMNDKDKINLIKTVERIVRRSLEYKQYIKFLKDEIDMTSCSFFSNISNKNNTSIGIEIHHEPFTLFDITQIIVEKFIDQDMEINPLLISDEVMKLHYRDMVGLIPLSTTVHQLVHDSKLFIPLQNVYGDYVKFLKEYAEYIPSEINNMLEIKLKLSKDINSADTSILEKKYVYLNVEGFTFPQIITK
jgi:hypothetical protein